MISDNSRTTTVDSSNKRQYRISIKVRVVFWGDEKAMKNETLTISGVLFNYIFESSQGQWCLTRKKSSNWSISFQSIFNSRSYPGPGINKSQCLDYCEQYIFSTRPSRIDFPLIRLVLRVSAFLSEKFDLSAISRKKLWNGTRNLLVPKILSQDRYQLLLFHADISFDFKTMDFGFKNYISNWLQVKWIKLYHWFDFSKESNVRVATKKLFWFESCSK